MSAPGAPAAGAAGEPAGDAEVRPDLANALVRGLRIASSAIVLVVLLGLVLPHLLADLPLYRPRWTGPAWTGPAWFGVLLAVAAVDAVLVARNRSWGVVRWPAAVVVLAASVWATALLPPAELVGPAHQTLGSVGWFGVLLFADLGVAAVLCFLGVHVGLTVVQLAGVGGLNAATVVDLVVVVVATGGFQVTTGAAGAALRRAAGVATDAARRQAATATAEAVAAQVHRDREERYARLRDSVLPLLRGVADGELSPADPDVRRRAALEAARLRRLFAEDGDVRDPLAAEVGALVELVERRGTEVQLSVRGDRPVPPPAVCRELVAQVGYALLAARREARVTLSAVGTGVAVSVVADTGTAGAAPVGDAAGAASGAPDAPDAAASGGTEITTFTVVDEERIWVEARWTPSTL